MNDIIKDIIFSWQTVDGVESVDSLLSWIEEKNKESKVIIKKIALSESPFWYYDDTKGVIKNKNDSFFYIAGLQSLENNKIVNEQPVIVQKEIGYLGLLCKKINGVLHFLMQAKIEPGNVNNIQLSPTIQATKSNFTQKHGGKKPAYLEFFTDSSKYEIVVDQIQSEQSSRFLKKRNRNIIINVGDEKIDVIPSHRWMTLGQIHKFLRIDNLVNMDTRTVLSCIPYCLSSLKYHEVEKYFKDKSLCASLFNDDAINFSSQIFHFINDKKMFYSSSNKIVPLSKMEDWDMKDNGIVSKKKENFKVIFCDIFIEGREVRNWTQPLFEAQGIATFCLLTKVVNKKLMLLVKANHEIGCFDEIELGPSIQLESNSEQFDIVTQTFNAHLLDNRGIYYDGILSEEGGRFYHEENRNIIIRIDENELCSVPKEYFWVDLKTLNFMVQFNNVLNIQLRNLLSLFEADYEKN